MKSKVKQYGISGLIQFYKIVPKFIGIQAVLCREPVADKHQADAGDADSIRLRHETRSGHATSQQEADGEDAARRTPQDMRELSAARAGGG